MAEVREETMALKLKALKIICIACAEFVAFWLNLYEHVYINMEKTQSAELVN